MESFQCNGEGACAQPSYKPSTHVCRFNPLDRCDIPEKCTGSSSSCPAADVRRGTAKAFKSVFVASGPAAWGPVMQLALPSSFQGLVSAAPLLTALPPPLCPATRCGRDCYFCGFQPDEVFAFKNGLAVGIPSLGQCNMGACETPHYIQPQTPDWLKYCAAGTPTICPNGKALGNLEHAVCGASAPFNWKCILKQDAPYAAGLTVVPTPW